MPFTDYVYVKDESHFSVRWVSGRTHQTDGYFHPVAEISYVGAWAILRIRTQDWKNESGIKVRSIEYKADVQGQTPLSCFAQYTGVLRHFIREHRKKVGDEQLVAHMNALLGVL